MRDRLTPREAKALIAKIIEHGRTVPTGHLKKRLRKWQLTIVDVTNVLRGGVVDEPESENGAWRYRVRTIRITVVVEFRSREELVIVTAWRTNQ